MLAAAAEELQGVIKLHDPANADDEIKADLFKYSKRLLQVRLRDWGRPLIVAEKLAIRSFSPDLRVLNCKVPKKLTLPASQI